MANIPESAAQRIVDLRNSCNVHIDFLHQTLEADSRRMFGMDHIAVSVINRSLALIDGFTAMVERLNPLCAGAILRLQLDSLMRFYACWLVDDPHSLLQPLLEGKPLRSIKSKDGNRLSDNYLKKEISKLYPWVESVYERTSGFVHLSRPHMLAPVVGVDNSSHSLLMHIEKEGKGREWTEEEMLEALDAFTEATKCLIHLLWSWLETKKKVAAERDLLHE